MTDKLLIILVLLSIKILYDIFQNVLLRRHINKITEKFTFMSDRTALNIEEFHLRLDEVFKERKMAKERIKKLKQLKIRSKNMQEFVKDASDQGLTIAMSEGRRLWHQLKVDNIVIKKQ